MSSSQTPTDDDFRRSSLPRQRGLSRSVYDLALHRLERIFDSFDSVIVSFSGGKDSTVLLELALKVAERRNRRIGVFHLDYEAQYEMTTSFVDATYHRLGSSIEALRCCVPVRCPTSTSMYDTHWRPWDPEKKNLWVRSLPDVYLGADRFDFITSDMTDYQFQTRLAGWYRRQTGAERVCVLVGIRADESLDRWRTIVSERNINKFDGLAWTTSIEEGVYNAYPLYDWSVEDIWTAIGKFGWSYNRLYDLFYKAGVPLAAMRVASPFNNFAKASLKLYRVIDSRTWGRMVSRVNGVNFTALYGDTKVMGWKNVTKPAHLTWREYALFLLDTLPQETADGFRAKLETSIRFWKDKGGVLSEDTIAELQSAGIRVEVQSTTNYRTTKRPVRMEYVDDFCGREFQFVPSWKRLVVCILKNDHVGKYMGFAMTKQEMLRRKAALEKYRDI